MQHQLWEHKSFSNIYRFIELILGSIFERISMDKFPEKNIIKIDTLSWGLKNKASKTKYYLGNNYQKNFYQIILHWILWNWLQTTSDDSNWWSFSIRWWTKQHPILKHKKYGTFKKEKLTKDL